jgi:hypothetical protein
MPHTAPSSRSNLRGLSQLRTGWSASGASYVNEIPAGPARDVSGFDFFQFRATVNFADSRNASGQAQDLSVRFRDAAGASQTLRAGQFSGALFFPPGTQSAVPKVWHNTVQLPLASLTGVDRTRISEVTLLFDQRASGALLVSDLHFYRRAGAPPSPSFNLAATPAERTVTAGGSTTYTVSVSPLGGFTGNVSLAASGLPAGATASFNPGTVSSGSGSSILTVAPAASTPTGSFALTITGTSGSIQKTAAVTLVVTSTGGGVVFLDNFETDKGWTRNPAGTDTATTGLWERGDPEPTTSSDGSGVKQLGTTTSGANDLVTGRLAGAAVGDHDVDAGTTSIQSPAIALPASGPLALSFQYYLAHGSNSSGEDFFRVRVVGATTATVLNVPGAAANRNGAWTSFSTDISSFAGQTIRILVDAADAGGASLVEAGVDDVRIAVSAPASVFADDFETDRGWTRNAGDTDTATTGLWERGDPEPTSSSGAKQLGTTISGVNGLVTGRLAGGTAGADDVDGGLTSIQSPAITLPGSGPLVLSFQYYLAHGSNSSGEDFFRVRVVGATTATVLSVPGAAANRDGAWTSFSTDISSFAGQAVRIVVEAADAGGASLVEAGVDDVAIVRSGAVTGP